MTLGFGPAHLFMPEGQNDSRRGKLPAPHLYFSLRRQKQMQASKIYPRIG